jgi:exodeoxyribonuclease-3
MKIATWNVNSLRVRMPHLLDWLKANPVDVIGLQEIKVENDKFPYLELEPLGYKAAVNGQKTYNGVAILSRLPIEDVVMDMPEFGDEHKRVIAATVGGLRFVNAYVVNGQAVGTPKYDYKLRWLGAFREHVQRELAAHPHLAVVGDYNIAPAAEDVHDPSLWEGHVLFSEPERAAFRALLELGLKDSFRLFPDAGPGFTWWDYRVGAFRRNLGLRIDHILVSAALAGKVSSVQVDKAPRKLERPSDHAPVVAEIKLTS